MIDVHQNAALSESFEGDRSRVNGNRCNKFVGPSGAKPREFERKKKTEKKIYLYMYR